MALCGIVIKWSSRGPMLYRAPRVGWRGQQFTMFKLRTMHVSDGSGGRITGASDGRVFRTGAWMRRLKLDEVPQLINVLRGEMVIVGPRPEDPTIVDEHYTDFMRQTLHVPPGLTSPGSLAYYAEEADLPSDSTEAEKVYLAQLLPRKIATDMVYVRNRSWRYDAEVVIRTVAGVLRLPAPFPGRRAWEQREASHLLAEASDGGEQV